jgi:hypothetical protein
MSSSKAAQTSHSHRGAGGVELWALVASAQTDSQLAAAQQGLAEDVLVAKQK